MTTLTLENLDQRLEEVERRLKEMQTPTIAPARDWRSVVGISQMSDFSRIMLAEMEATREADRKAAEAESSYHVDKAIPN